MTIEIVNEKKGYEIHSDFAGFVWEAGKPPKTAPAFRRLADLFCHRLGHTPPRAWSVTLTATGATLVSQ